jgi:hypothetical protein
MEFSLMQHVSALRADAHPLRPVRQLLWAGTEAEFVRDGDPHRRKFGIDLRPLRMSTTTLVTAA